MNQTLPSTVSDAAADFGTEIAALATRYRRANGPVMRLVGRIGGTLETQLAALPEGVRRQMEALTAQALETSYGLAGRAPDLGRRGPVVAALATGAAGGVGGLGTAMAELPVTVTLFLNTIRAVAEAEGFDPDDPQIRAEALQVFAAGSPLAEDDGVNSSFIAARLTLTGSAMKNLIASIAPKLATVLGQKLVAQAVPVIGALSGAALNVAFLSYYREIAAVRFRLLRLSQLHGAERVQQEFRLAVTPPKIVRA